MFRLVSDLRARWRSRLLLTAAVAGVCSVVLMLAAGAYRTSSVADRYERSIGLDFDATVIQGTGVPMTEEVRSLPAVRRAESYTFVFGGLASMDSHESTSALVFAGFEQAIGARLVRGRSADPSTGNEFVATPSFMEETGAELGARFRLSTFTQGQGDSNQFGSSEPAGPTIIGTLVGVVDGPQMIEFPTPIAVFPRRLLDQSGIGVSQTGVVVELAAGADLLRLRTELDALPGGANLSIDSAEVISPAMRRAISAQAWGSWFLAIAAAIAATAALGQVLTRQLRLSTPERTTLTAIGFTDRQILAEVSARAALPIVIGGLVGAALSVAGSGWFPVGYVRPIEPSPGPLVQWEAFPIMVGTLMVAVLVWVVVWSYRSQAGVRAVRPSPTLDAIAGFASPAAGLGVRFAFTRASRERGSVRATMAGVALTLAGLVAAVTFGASVGRLIDEPFRYGSNFDVALGDNGGQAIDPVLASNLRDDPDVTSLMFYAVAEAHAGASTVLLSGLEAVRGTGTPVVLSGKLPITADEIALGRVTAHDLGVGVGDSIELVGPTGLQSFHVTGLVVVSGFGRNEGIGKGGVVMLPGLARLDAAAAIVVAAVRFEPGSHGIDKYRAMFPEGSPDERFQPSAIVNIARVRTVPFLLAAVLAVLAVLTLSHGLFTAVRARRRDLAVLEALGASRRFVSRVVHWQASAFAAGSALLAAPIGFVLGRTVFARYADGIGAVDSAALPMLAVGGVAAGIVVLANIVAAMPARMTRRATTAVVLQTE